MVAKNSRNIDIQIGILVAVVAAILIPLNIYRNKVGKNASLAITVILIIVAGVIIYEMVTRHEDIPQLAETVETKFVEDIENFTDVPVVPTQIVPEVVPEVVVPEVVQTQPPVVQTTNVPTPLSNEDYESVQQLVNQDQASVLNSDDLLPKISDNQNATGSSCPKWGEEIIIDGPGNIVDPEVLVGIDTVGQSLRNASLDLRAAPIIPKTDVCPWNNSTIEADLLRKPLEICDEEGPVQDIPGYSPSE